MDIHKPKPWHGLREFLKEYGIIVLGVLTALALEQGVEWLHTQNDLRETREALRAEIGQNAANAVASAEQGKCQIAWAERSIAWARGGPRPNVPPPASIPLISAAWDSTHSGTVLRMPLEERLKFADYYSLVEDTKLLDRQFRDALNRTHRYTRLQHLDPAQAKSLEEEMNAIIPLLAGVVAEDGLAFHAARQFGAKPPRFDGKDEGSRLIEQLCSAAGGPKPTFTITGDLHSVWESYARMAGDGPASEAKR